MEVDYKRISKKAKQVERRLTRERVRAYAAPSLLAIAWWEW